MAHKLTWREKKTKQSKAKQKLLSVEEFEMAAGRKDFSEDSSKRRS